MPDVEFVDQTLRDGQQSLWGLRMRAYQAADALPHLDRTGFRVVDLTGPGMFTVLLREFADDPWASTDFLVRNLPNNTVRAGMRTTAVIGFAQAPDAIIDLWVRTLIRHGVTSFWIYDCLYDMPTMRRLADVINQSGGQAVPSIMYGLTGVHDDAFFADRAKEIAGWDGVESIYVEDAPGVLTPERARTLLPAIRAATGSIPLELHCHATTGLAQHNYIEGLEAGFTILHTASRPMANGPSLPSTEGMLPILDHLGLSHGLDVDRLAPVEENFVWAARDAGFEPGAPAEYDPRIYQHQVPGGMTGTLRNQLATHGMAHRLDEVLAEIPRVREELGHPIMATPFSQFVGIQAVLNIVAGDRYELVPDEVVHYALEHYGPLASPLDPDVADKILSGERARTLAKWERPQPTIEEIRRSYPLGISDEDLLLRYMTSDEEVETMKAAGPIRTDPRRSANAIVNEVVDLIAETRSVTSLHVSRPGLEVRLARSGS
ncbi:carboxyltransferase [Pseudonocardia endophytica]|uniref:Oxaloacetate decarboxylase alpha subunit n=1 Tax=Pseudonocardia endophytica TaxID=401976 RepID=A0A4R1HN72_PSEEN|nr:carboxyltransferase [Pseudonocardia endophytica]TCK22035.1 oxaloacetate decarboxylase alpha subunit [Pseudonocardia endophytica]